MPFLASLLFAASLSLAVPVVAGAQATSDNAEARVYFEEGNRLYQEASRSSGSRRETLLQRSLEAYVDSLQIVRSRNALFNAAIVLGELERYDESFNYLSEYLRIDGLPADDVAEAERRRDALRDRVAVLRVVTVPEGALLFVDRKDLAPRGETPIELAVPAGEHRIFIEREDYLAVERTETMVRGETLLVEQPLEPLPLPTPIPIEPEPKVEPLPPAKPRIRNAAIGTAAATVATAAAAIGVSVRARSLRDDANQAAADFRESGDPADRQRAEDLANRTDRFNITADVLWGTTIALGVTAIVLYGVHVRKKKKGPDVAVSISRDGGFASLTMPIGASR